MQLKSTQNQILAQQLGRATISDGALSSWKENFSAIPTVQRAQFYTDLVAAISVLEMTFDSWPRLIEDFVGIRQGTGSVQYLITKVNPKHGIIYDPEFDAASAVEANYGKHKPDLRQQKIATPRNWTDFVTIQEDGIESANWEGQLELASGIIDSLGNANRQDEYYYFLDLLWQYIRSGVAYEQKVAPVTDGDTARSYSASMGTVLDFMSKPSNLFNPGRLTQTYKKSDIRYITRSTNAQAIFKDQYSAAFNKEYMRGVTDEQIITVPDFLWPEDLKDISGVFISMGDDPTLMCFDNSIRSGASVNEAWYRVNHSVTQRSITGANQFGALVLFKDGTPEIIGSAVPVPTEVELDLYLNGAPVQGDTLNRGYMYEVRAFAKDKNGLLAGRANVNLTGSESPTKATFVQLNDLNLAVGRDEASDTITLTVDAVYDQNVKLTKTYNITGELQEQVPPFDITVKLTGSNLVTFSGNTATPPSETEGYNLTVKGKVAGENVDKAFTEAVTLTQAGDSITVTANAAPGYKLTGTKTRTLSYS